MTDEHDTINLAVRSLVIVDAAGVHRRHLRVFCPVESRSLDPSTCARCDLCVSFPEGLDAKGAELCCRTPRRSDPPRAASWFVGTDAISTWLPAGAIASALVVCARFDAPTQAVDEALERHEVGTAVVVDERTRVLGVVGHSHLMARRSLPVLAVVDADVPQIEEGAPLSQVISSMAYRRAHRVVLVQQGGVVSALVTEVDVLHWIAGGGASW